MKQGNCKLFTLIILFILSLGVNASTNLNKKEILSNKISFLLMNQKDSLLIKDYEEVRTLFEAKKYPQSLDKAFTLLKADLSDDLLYRTNFLIGDVYARINNHSESILYYKKALNLLEKNNFVLLDSKISISKEIELARVHLKLGNEYFRNNQRDSAKRFYDNTLKINALNSRVLSYQASASTNLSGIYMQDSLYVQAKSYAEKAVEIHKKRNNKVSEAVALSSLASIYLEENNYIKAKEKYKKALELIKYESSDRALNVREKIYFNLAYNLYKLKDYEAYTYQELSYNIKDSLRDKEYRAMIEELGFKYDFEAKKELFQKQEELKLLKEKDKTRTIVILGVSILVILLFLLGYYNLRQKNLGLKLSQTELIQSQKLEKLKSESQIRILNATIDGKESERKEIAETLHDSVSALLSSASLHLQATRGQFNGTTPIEIEKTQEIITEASQKIRDLSHTLVSSVLLKFGLTFALKDMADKYSNSQLTISTEIKNLRRYHQKFEIKIHNIIQEFVNNILKHSGATKALIELKEEEGKILLRITDDGKGFDKTKITEKDGLGINQIDARIQMMQGQFHIDSKKGKGTTIKVELPVIESKVPSNV